MRAIFSIYREQHWVGINPWISVRINAWNNAFYNALQAFNSGELFRGLGTFCILVAFAVAMSVYALYLNQMLQIRWRRWLTRRYLGAWLADRAYYSCSCGTRPTTLTSVSRRIPTNLPPTY
jgi:ABC-type uncharacterized transport system fused permease/ATPase subunit